MLKTWQALLDLRATLWFIPSVTVLFAIGLAAAMIELDTRFDMELAALSPRLFGASADGARGMLEVIAAAMITTATLTFSITVLVLSNVSAQYAPALIRNFMASRSTQTVLGTFLGIFAYCLIVLRTVRSGEDAFIPAIAIAVAIVLAMTGIGVLVYFVHHIASSIQAEVIISTIAATTLKSIASRYHRADDSGSRPANADDAFRDQTLRWHPVPAQSTGHLRSVDLPGLERWAQQHDLLLKLETGIGGFICCDAPLGWTSRPLSEAMRRSLDGLHAIGNFRTVEQDPAVGLQQLVDIALKAMSPAVCNNSTALLCMNYLSAMLAALAASRLAVGAEATRVSIPEPEFRDYLRLAVASLRDHANDDPAIYAGLLQMLATVARLTDSPIRKRQILSEVELLAQYARQQLCLPGQLMQLENSIAEARAHASGRFSATWFG